ILGEELEKEPFYSKYYRWVRRMGRDVKRRLWRLDHKTPTFPIRELELYKDPCRKEIDGYLVQLSLFFDELLMVNAVQLLPYPTQEARDQAVVSALARSRDSLLCEIERCRKRREEDGDKVITLNGVTDSYTRLITLYRAKLHYKLQLIDLVESR